MQDLFQADNEPGPHSEAPDTAPESITTDTPPATRPAATASSYRDIIAERLARKSGGVASAGSASPMAHSSDVEWSVPPNTKVSTSSANADTSETTEGTPSVPKGSTDTSEDSTGHVASEGLTSRDRARARQQERAALRRGGERRPRVESEQPIAEPMPTRQTHTAETKSSETISEQEPTNAGQDIIAARLTKGTPHSARPERPERTERPERAERPERTERRERRPENPLETKPGREPREAPNRERREETPQETAATAPGLTLKSARPTTTIASPEAPDRGMSRKPDARHPQERMTSRSREHDTNGMTATPAVRASAAEQTSAMALAGKLGISVIVPLYNEQDSLRELTAALKQQCLNLAGPKYEILFVNDGSTDRSGEILQDILATGSRVTAISFRRNLGKSAALAAGFAEAQYGIVITMDADLQDDPREFVNLIGKLAEGYDLVSGWKKKRHDPISKTAPSKFFNWVTSIFSGIHLHDFNCGLKAYRKEVTESLQVYGELHRYLPALAYWQGFRVTEIPVTHHPRKFGKSKFGSSRFFKGFLDLLSIVFTNRYGKRPLHLFGTVGTLMGVAGFIIDVWLTVEWALGRTSLSNRPLLLLGLLLILVGVQLISLGLLGEMIVKNSISRSSLSYSKEKGRPSAEARERRASHAAKLNRITRNPERRGPRRNP